MSSELSGDNNEMRGGKLQPAYLIMVLLLLSTGTDSEDKKKEEESNNSPPPSSPPSEDKGETENPSSPAEETKPPAKEDEKPKQVVTKKSPPPPAEKKEKPVDPPSTAKETKSSAKEKEKSKKETPKKDKEDASKDKDKVKKEEEPLVIEENSKKGNSEKETDKKKNKDSSDKEKKKSSQSGNAVVGVNPTGPVEVEDNWLLSIMKMVDKKGMVTKVVTQVPFTPLPNDLKGISEEEIMAYVKVLDVERENIQERFLFVMGLKMFVGLVSYEYYNHNMLLPPLRYLAENDINLSASIEKQWGDHQERLANFLLNVMEVRKIDAKTLPKSQLGIPLMKLNREKDAVVSFPVWRTEANAELPVEAKQISTNSRAMLLNFWVN